MCARPRNAYATPAPAIRKEEEHTFYERRLSSTERSLFRRARDERGLESEIALLRLQIYYLLQDTEGCCMEPDMLPVAARLIDLLIKALRTRDTGDDAGWRRFETLIEAETEEILKGLEKAAE